MFYDPFDMDRLIGYEVEIIDAIADYLVWKPNLSRTDGIILFLAWNDIYTMSPLMALKSRRNIKRL